ncbi:MAG: hypothetical protein ACLP7J_05930 [Streptosporangiaceae bacterium]
MSLQTSSPPAAVGTVPARAGRLPGWAPAAAIAALAAAGLALFFASLRGVPLARMSGIGLLSVLPHTAVAGVLMLALALVGGLLLQRPHPAVLSGILAALVVCLDGVTAFIEPEARFATSYQIAGFVNYISTTGHTAPGLAAYFSWPGFFALVSFLTRAAGTHGLLTTLRIWPMAIELAYLPPLFLIMSHLRVSWRARWLAGFLFIVGNWVGQDYFSPQAFNYLLYLVFVAILVNWFVDPGLSRPPRVIAGARLARLHRRVFGIVRPAEIPPRPASTGMRMFLLALLIAIFFVSTASHQLTPFYMLGACTVLVLIRRCTLTGLPVLLGTIVVGWVSYAAVDYWSGHMANIFGGLGNVGANLTTSVGGRLTGSTPTHLLALHARVGVAAIMAILAGLGVLRRRNRGLDDRVLLTLLCMPAFSIVLQSYGGEMALRIYLFLLPAAAVLAACFFFPHERSGPPGWRLLPVLAGCALVLPVAFILVRYGNEAFEQIPPGELAASSWVYAHDGQGARLLWLSSDPATDNTPELPWSYQDLSKVAYYPEQAPRNPAEVAGLVAALRSAGPGSCLIATQTQEAELRQTAGYPPDWGPLFSISMASARGVRIGYANSSAVIYLLHYPAGARRQPLPPTVPAGPGHPVSRWSMAGLAGLFLLLVLLAGREFIRVVQPSSRLIRPITITSLPLIVLVLTVVALRFAGLS